MAQGEGGATCWVNENTVDGLAPFVGTGPSGEVTLKLNDSSTPRNFVCKTLNLVNDMK